MKYDNLSNKSKMNSSELEKPLKFYQFKTKLVYTNVLLHLIANTFFLYSIYLIVFGHVKFISAVYAYSYAYIGALTVTIGAHRLWSHNSFKATWQLKLLLIVLNTIAFQNPIYDWVRDHRLHHKYTDTNADPHNIQRGFLFAHFGWLCMKKHPDVISKGATIDMTDLKNDKFVMFQKKYYIYMVSIFSLAIPWAMIYHTTSETILNSFLIGVVFRYMLSLHLAWLVNSAAHMWGWRPYDKSIKSADNVYVGILAAGEGWHNYHHVFPWDYKAAESITFKYNVSGVVIDLFAKIGWAYDLKTVSEEMIRKRAIRSGDGTCVYSKCLKYISICKHTENVPNNVAVWGWSDRDMLITDKQNATVLKQRQ